MVSKADGHIDWAMTARVNRRWIPNGSNATGTKTEKIFAPKAEPSSSRKVEGGTKEI